MLNIPVDLALDAVDGVSEAGEVIERDRDDADERAQDPRYQDQLEDKKPD